MSASITFVTPPLGLGDAVEFSLRGVDGAEGLFALEAADGARLFVLDASRYVPDYSPEINDAQAGLIGLEKAEDGLALVVANPTEGGTTVNLLAPIVLNLTNGLAAQLILDDQDWSLQHRLTVAQKAAS